MTPYLTKKLKSNFSKGSTISLLNQFSKVCILHIQKVERHWTMTSRDNSSICLVNFSQELKYIQLQLLIGMILDKERLDRTKEAKVQVRTLQLPILTLTRKPKVPEKDYI
jgi:hypothetical protein